MKIKSDRLALAKLPVRRPRSSGAMVFIASGKVVQKPNPFHTLKNQEEDLRVAAS